MLMSYASSKRGYRSKGNERKVGPEKFLRNELYYTS